MLKQAVREAFTIIIAAVAVALAVYAVRPDRIVPGPEAVTPGTEPPAAVADGIAPIPIEAAFRHFEDQTAVFADARHPADYAAGHIPGALSLYAADPEPWLGGLLTDLDPATLLITYCDGEECHLATQLAELLVINGFVNVRYLKNGWTRWRESGYPTE